jgi:predicted dehydrogenase
MGKPIKARAQWHKKQSWRRTSANPEREKEMNWRLDRATSPGLVAEVGVHQLDLCSWVFNERPISVFGSGEVLQWNDGRDVPDTVQAIVEYPGGVRLFYEATLANSFEAEYEVLYGADSAVMLRGARGWMFKEADSPALGWEMHAKKEEFFQDTGITLIANASKQAPATDKPIEATAPEKTPLQAAIEAFVANAANHAEAVADFVASFGEGAQGLGEFLAKTLKNHLPCAGWREGWEATVVALRTNEAILKGQKLLLDKSAFEV